MAATLVSPARAVEASETVSARHVAADPPSLWHAYTVVFAATCVMTGVYWDISWHMSIGRDTFWTPAHLLIQAGGLIAGLSSGYVALRTTFAGSDTDRAASVRFWGFRAPLGAWICIWGCLAMLTSAPFDNWWHNAYGLDVKIISPPHAVLALGIFAITLGALLLTLAAQNRADDATRRRLALVLAVTGGLVLMNLAVFLTEYSERRMMHSPLFFNIVSGTCPVVLCMLARAVKLRWPATASAAVFTAMMLALMWIIQFFPATPKLGPIYQHVTHMVALSFPLLLIVPAVAIDLVMRRLGARLNALALAPILGVVFVATFVAAQWPFADFLTYSPMARGWLFNADNFVYWAPPSYAARSHQFITATPDVVTFVTRLVPAVLLATVASWLGLTRGSWMTKVQR